jgi:hypothetical protein
MEDPIVLDQVFAATVGKSREIHEVNRTFRDDEYALCISDIPS